MPSFKLLYISLFDTYDQKASVNWRLAEMPQFLLTSWGLKNDICQRWNLFWMHDSWWHSWKYSTQLSYTPYLRFMDKIILIFKPEFVTWGFFFFFFLIGIHSMQGSTRHGVTRKRSRKRAKHTGNLFRKNLQLKRCLLILDLKPLRSWVKGKHSIGREL